MPPELLALTAGPASDIRAALSAGLPRLLVRETSLDQWDFLPDGPRIILHARWPDAEAIAKSRGWGLHLPGNLPFSDVRTRFSGRLGKSTHSRAEAEEMLQSGADYVLLSPVFPPTSKPDDRRPTLGPEVLGPGIWALGGITPERVELCKNAGGIAVLGGIFGTSDVEAAVHRYSEALVKLQISAS